MRRWNTRSYVLLKSKCQDAQKGPETWRQNWKLEIGNWNDESSFSTLLSKHPLRNYHATNSPKSQNTIHSLLANQTPIHASVIALQPLETVESHPFYSTNANAATKNAAMPAEPTTKLAAAADVEPLDPAPSVVLLEVPLAELAYSAVLIANALYEARVFSPS